MSTPAGLLGIEIGGTKLQLVRGDGRGAITHRARFPVDPARGAAGIRNQVEAVVRAWKSERPFAAFGVGFGGPVDWQTGQVSASFHIEGWRDFPLAAWLRELAGAPGTVDNDATVAALAEATLGAGRGLKLVFYTNQGTGVGGGMVIDGQIYHGASPGEAELGHVWLDRSGTTVEQRCSGRAVDARIRSAVAAAPDGVLARLVGSETAGEARFLREAIAEGDSAAQEILAAAAEDLAFGLSHVSHLFHSDGIVLGGGLSLIGEPWRAAVSSALSRQLMTGFQPGPRVLLSALGEDVVVIGALLVAAQAAAAAPAFQPPDRAVMRRWLGDYVAGQKAALDSIPLDQIAALFGRLQQALDRGRMIFVFGNGGSAANASHFATDLGKGASDKLTRRFRVLSLNDNMAWVSALGNDYAYEDTFVRQLQNHAGPGDLVLTMSVSGNSPNLIKAVAWARANGLETVALVGGNRGRLAEIADEAIVIGSTHYGQVEDAHMGICHMVCYAFMDQALVPA